MKIVRIATSLWLFVSSTTPAWAVAADVDTKDASTASTNLFSTEAVTTSGGSSLMSSLMAFVLNTHKQEEPADDSRGNEGVGSEKTRRTSTLNQLRKGSSSKFAKSAKVPKSMGPKKKGSPKKKASMPTLQPTTTQDCSLLVDTECRNDPIVGGFCPSTVMNGQTIQLNIVIVANVTSNPFTIVNVTLDLVLALDNGTNLTRTDVLTSQIVDPVITTGTVLVVSTMFFLDPSWEGTLSFRSEALGETPTGETCSAADDGMRRVDK